MLKQHQEAPGRVWLLLRAIDHDGRGWLTVDEARKQLTGKDSPLRCCGWRRLRQLLREGTGIFWHRDEQDRLWLGGAHRIAYTLDCGRLQGFPLSNYPSRGHTGRQSGFLRRFPRRAGQQTYQP